MKERLTQLGLVGFGKETDSQLSTQEVEPATFVIPQNTTIFRSINSDLGLTCLSSFYVTKREGAKVVKGIIKVTLVEDGVEVYRDGKRYSLAKGEVIEVPIKRLVKKQRDRF